MKISWVIPNYVNQWPGIETCTIDISLLWWMLHKVMMRQRTYALIISVPTTYGRLRDAIIATADLLQRNFIIHISINKISPMIYSPKLTWPKQQSVRVAFYESGHYRPMLEQYDAYQKQGN